MRPVLGEPRVRMAIRRAAVAALVTLALGALTGCAPEPEPALIVVAVENEGMLALLDADSGRLLDKIDLAETTATGRTQRFLCHNVEVAPDARLAWVTAMPAGSFAAVPEQLIGVDLSSREVVQRIPLGAGVGAMHVTLHGETAFVTAFEKNRVLEVDLIKREIVGAFVLSPDTRPHGLRVTPDGRQLVVAGMGRGALVVIDRDSGRVVSHDLTGRAVQTAVSPDGRLAFATIYDSRELARLELDTGTLTTLALPGAAQGPIQLYPSPDGRFLWVADQGVVDGRPMGRSLYRVDVASGQTTMTVAVSPAPHGVVVAPAGDRVYVTSVGARAVEIIDAESGRVLTTTPVGDGPNGISYRPALAP